MIETDDGMERAVLQHQFEESPPNDPVKAAQAELTNVREIMVKNLESVR